MERPLLIDTHSHLYHRKFESDQAAVIQRAQAVLSAVVLPNIDQQSVEAMHALSAQAPDFFFPAMGLHPSSVKEDFEAVLAELKIYLDDPARQYCAIGEAGIDLYWPENQAREALQVAALLVQIDWAKAYQLPLILHTREATDLVIDLIEQNLDESLRGIFHCFDGTAEQAARIATFGSFKLGIGGALTYRKGLQAVIAELDLSLLVLETDSPFMAPEPYRKSRNRRNESSYTPLVAEKMAELKGISYAEVAQATNANARDVFSKVLLPQPDDAG